ncbi:MAG TPA: glycosyl hydrolase [Methylocella sp.]|nr:glycosyl hydrolase [Methylocella sp.]
MRRFWKKSKAQPLRRRPPGRRIALALAAALPAGLSPLTAAAQAQENAPGPAAARSGESASPWGAASGAEWLDAYPKFNPLLAQAGVKWLRGFYEWQTIEPKEGEWRWGLPDALAADAKANDLQLLGVLAYLAPWASSGGGTRAFPLKNPQYWRDYVTAAVSRYSGTINDWEVWNEFNGSFAVNGTPAVYANLVRDAYDAAKKIDPEVRIGISAANFDIGFLNAAIGAGAAGHFDFVAVHPYEILDGVEEGGEIDFLSMAGNLRRMLNANHERPGLPLWITEIGVKAPSAPDPEGDNRQQIALAKAFILGLASGFERIFWFEPRGPSYGQDGDFGLIRAGWSLRPSYYALRTLTDALGPKPSYLGWLDLDRGAYGFLFQGREGPVLAAWSPQGEEHKISFANEVLILSLDGSSAALEAERPYALTGKPVLITRVPPSLANLARRNAGKPFPWGGDYAGAKTVSCRLQADNEDKGLRQIRPRTTVPANVDGVPARRLDFARPDGEGHYAYFRTSPRFAPFGVKSLEITALVRRLAPDKPAGLTLDYESMNGYAAAPGWAGIPAGQGWQKVTWKVSDASFAGAWGYDFRLNAAGSPNEFYIKEVRVRKLTKAQ